MSDLCGAVPMPQRDVVSRGAGKMCIADEPGWPGTASKIGSGFVVAVSQGNLPARPPRPDSFERDSREQDHEPHHFAR